MANIFKSNISQKKKLLCVVEKSHFLCQTFKICQTFLSQTFFQKNNCNVLLLKKVFVLSESVTGF